METAHPLSAWLDTNGVKQAQFANDIGMSESHLSLILSGQRMPSPQLAVKIERLTKIDVRALLGISTEEPAE